MSNIVLCGHGSGRPRTIDMQTYLASRYKQTVTKGGKTWHKGVVAVLRPIGMDETSRRQYQKKYATILGRNKYSQSLRKYCYSPYKDGYYYSDCSSSQTLTLAAIGFAMPSYNTEEMYKSSLFTKVPVKISNGMITNPEVLRVGDMLLFAGSDPDRTLHIGHVEGVYSIGKAPAPEPVPDNTVAKYQRFLNENYKQIVSSSIGGLLDPDGEYGPKTRAASVAVWKFMINKYYNGELDPANPNFYESSTDAADSITNAEVKKHPTFGYILNGVLAGRGYPASFSGSITAETTKGIMELQNKLKMSVTGRLTAELWFCLFN